MTRKEAERQEQRITDIEQVMYDLTRTLDDTHTDVNSVAIVRTRQGVLVTARMTKRLFLEQPRWDKVFEADDHAIAE